jgi:PhzF family phenazine biosynthesis protein
MELTLYQIDAFANRPFEGNPAAVCPLRDWLPDEIMQSVSEENNLSETAFFIPTVDGYHIRWFTPKVEVDLCGHATLAASYVLFNIIGIKQDKIDFQSRSGVLTVSKENEWLVMNFPSQPPELCEMPENMIEALGKSPVECLKSKDYMVVFEKEEDILLLKPRNEELQKLDLRGVIATAKSSKYDFVVRFFAPKYGISEDPVTGSAFTQLAPYWSEKLGKTRLHARQVSNRGGELICEIINDRVNIFGKAVKYFEGRIQVPVE